jgi:hypothetical protein
MNSTLGAAAIAAAISTATVASADPQFAVEARGGLNVPTFDITDAADPGPSFGLGLGVLVAPKVMLFADADFGTHSGADLGGGVDHPDITVSHVIGKVGYNVYSSPDGKLDILANAGAGIMIFDVDGGADAFTYPAINVGLKIAYAIAPQVDILLSPQGDIAFTDEAEVGTDNAWVWPFAAGLRLRF